MTGQDSGWTIAGGGHDDAPGRPAAAGLWNDIDVDDLHVVQDRNQAALLTDPVRVRFLYPFLGRESTVGEAAEALGTSTNSMLYRVRRMARAGLLHVVEERPRAGRAIKVYRSVHDGYRVPLEAMRFDDVRHRVDVQGRPLMEDVASAYSAALLATARHDRVVSRTRSGELWSTDLLPEVTGRGEALHMSDTLVSLTPQKAGEIRDRLRAVLREALEADSDVAGQDRRTYLLMSALLPRPS